MRSLIKADPIIFKGLKCLTLADSQQQSLLRLALEGISVIEALHEPIKLPRSSRFLQVYSPHTAVDAVPGGLGDWLADIVTGTLSEPEPATKTASVSETKSGNKNGDEGKLAPPDDDPFVEKPLKKHPGRIALRRTYSRPTYPQPTELEQTDLAPSVRAFSLSLRYDD